MSTLTIKPGKVTRGSAEQKTQKAAKIDAPASKAELKEQQKAELKQGLTEAVLISRGKIDGIPLSKLWDE